MLSFSNIHLLLSRALKGIHNLSDTGQGELALCKNNLTGYIVCIVQAINGSLLGFELQGSIKLSGFDIGWGKTEKHKLTESL